MGCILLTRPLKDSKRIAPDFEELGYETALSPVLEINYFDFDFDLPLPPHDIICLSSQNALPALKEVAKDTPLFCVGVYTKKCLQDLGFHHLTSAPTAKELHTLLTQQRGKILYLAGTVTRFDFSDHLPNCQKLICYEATPLTHLNKEIHFKQITHIPFYSLRSAELLNKLLIENKINLGSMTALALSKDIAEALKATTQNTYNFKEILTAETPTHQGIIALLKQGRHNV